MIIQKIEHERYMSATTRCNMCEEPETKSRQLTLTDYGRMCARCAAVAVQAAQAESVKKVATTCKFRKQLTEQEKWNIRTNKGEFAKLSAVKFHKLCGINSMSVEVWRKYVKLCEVQIYLA